MQCKELIAQLNRLAPPEYACEWDNSGFLAGRAEKEIHKILIALDVTDEVVEQAIAEQADLLLTHHPLIFKPLKKINDEHFISRRIVKLIQADICYFAMHTNFDVAPGCMADLAAEQFGLLSEEPLEITGEAEGKPIGIGKIGSLEKPMSVEEVGRKVKECFGLPYVVVYGMDQVKEPVTRVALSPGSGGSMIRHGLEKQAQVLITGDIGHHEGIDAAANHMAVIDAGHYGLEHIFIPFMKQYLQETMRVSATIVTAEPAFPTRVL